ncbi:MAG: hypothetical protein Q9187_008870 [Circinaria calcarea]
MKRIYLIDCPGVVPPSNNDSEQDILLRGVVRVENVENPEQYIAAVLSKTKPQHIERTYDIKGYSDSTEFLELLARKGGRLLKGGEADVDGVAKMVLNDFLRGKIPWFTPPPVVEGEVGGKGVEGREGRLGEMGKKRKREDDDTADSSRPTESVVADAIAVLPQPADEIEEFEGFEEENGGVEIQAEISPGLGTDAEDSDTQQQESLARIEEG